ncbi:MAG: helix-turn-helix domain-containing protein [Planktomarina sp.]
MQKLRGLREMGKTPPEIAKELSLGRSTVYRLIKQTQH